MSIYRLYVILALLGAAVSLGLALYALQNRESTASKSFSLWMLGGFIWAASCGLSALSQSPEQAIFWIYPVRYSGIAIGSSMLAKFATDYTGRWESVPKFIKASLYVLPLISIVILFTPGHQLVWYDIETVQLDTYWFVIVGDVGLWYWVFVFTGFGFAFYGLTLLVIRALSGFAIYRWRTLLIVGSTLLPIFSSLWMTVQEWDSVQVDITAITIAIVGPIWGWTIFRGQFFNVLPIAHDVVIQHVRDAIFVVDKQGYVVELNRAAVEFLGEPEKSHVNRQVEDLFQKYPNIIKQLNNDSKTIVEVEIIQKNIACYYNLNRIPLYLKEKHEVGSLITLHDVTDIHQSEQRRLDLARERERIEILSSFIRDASHDLKTPLSTMNTSIYLLGRELDGIGHGHERLDTMQFQVNRLHKLVDDMLFMTKLDEQSTLLLKEGDVNLLMDVAISKVKDTYAEHTPTITLTAEENLPPIQISTHELTRAFVELLSNAILHSDAPATVVVRLRNEPKYLTIEIADNGRGIAEHEVNRIYQRFYRGDIARGTQTGGTGLGLSIVQRIISLHNGKIEVIPNKPQGSIFRVMLPTTTQSID